MPAPLKLASRLAQAVSEANSVYRQYATSEPGRAWATMTNDEQRDVLLAVARTLELRTASAEECHAEWLKHREAAGWKYAEVMDPEKKESPYMMPWEQLKPEGKAKSELYLAILKLFYGV